MKGILSEDFLIGLCSLFEVALKLQDDAMGIPHIWIVGGQRSGLLDHESLIFETAF